MKEDGGAQIIDTSSTRLIPSPSFPHSLKSSKCQDMPTFDTLIQPLFLGPELDTHTDPSPNGQVSHTNLRGVQMYEPKV
jgi:hypothetical protein